MSVVFSIIATHPTERPKMELACSVCLGKMKVEIVSLCDNHYFEWSSEKGFADLNSSEDYFHLV